MGHAAPNPSEVRHEDRSINVRRLRPRVADGAEERTGRDRWVRMGGRGRSRARCGSVQVAGHAHQDFVVVGVPHEGLPSDACVADPHREFAPVARLQLDVRDAEVFFEELRQPGGAWVVVSD